MNNSEEFTDFLKRIYLRFLDSAQTILFVVSFFLILYSAGGPGGGPDMGIIVSTYVGLILTGLGYVSIGLFWSSVTESVLIALVLTFVTNFTFGILFCIAVKKMEAGVRLTQQDS
jgi:ABC-type transport system involved in multi-copper enzyme maturation permease subunit